MSIFRNFGENLFRTRRPRTESHPQPQVPRTERPGSLKLGDGVPRRVSKEKQRPSTQQFVYEKIASAGGKLAACFREGVVESRQGRAIAGEIRRRSSSARAEGRALASRFEAGKREFLAQADVHLRWVSLTRAPLYRANIGEGQRLVQGLGTEQINLGEEVISRANTTKMVIKQLQDERDALKQQLKGVSEDTASPEERKKLAKKLRIDHRLAAAKRAEHAGQTWAGSSSFRTALHRNSQKARSQYLPTVVNLRRQSYRTGDNDAEGRGFSINRSGALSDYRNGNTNLR